MDKSKAEKWQTPQVRPCSYTYAEDYRGPRASHDAESNCAELCGCCGGHASVPDRFNHCTPGELATIGGLFNECDKCGAECGGFDPDHGNPGPGWWHWTNSRSAKLGRARLAAAMEDAGPDPF